MTPKIRRRTAVVIIIVILLSSLGAVFVFFMQGQSSPADLKILVVTGEGLQETYGFYSGSHVGNGYNYYRDRFWTESTGNWTPSTSYASITVDPSRKVYGDYSVQFDFNVKYPRYYFYHRTRPYGYLAEEGEKWLYFSIMFNSTTQINEFEVKAADFGGANYFSKKYSNVSSYAANEWIRFKIQMNNMESFGAPNWSNIYRLQFDILQVPAAPLKVWIDDMMITSTYQYELALKNMRAMFKGVSLDVINYDKLPSNIDHYSAVLYLDNRINSTGVSLIDQYASHGGGLVLMGLSTLWQSDGSERIDFPIGASPVSILSSKETFIDNANTVDWFENHSALKPWNNYTLFEQRALAGSRPRPYLGIAEVYNVSLRSGATPLITEKGYVYEAVKQHGSGKVIYFAENLAKRIANGMLEAQGLVHGFGSLGWAAATGDRLQLLESAVEYVSKYPLPKVLTIPFAKKGAFIFTVETTASINFYSYVNKSCTNIAGPPSNDTAFWYTVERMKNESDETGVTFTLLIATEQLVPENRTGHIEAEFDPKNIEALQTAFQSPTIELGLLASNMMTWEQDATNVGLSYSNMWQGVLDLRSALNLSDYDPLVWRYPRLARRGDSMIGTKNAGLYLDVSDESGSGIPFSDSVAVPYMMEVDTWKLQNRGAFTIGGIYGTRVETGDLLLKREETYFDWYAENDMVYAVNTNDAAIAGDPSHIHESLTGTGNYSSKWVQTPIFLKYVAAQSDTTWIVGGVTFAQYLRSWTTADASTIYNAKTHTYTFTLRNAPDGLTLRVPLNGMHVSNLVSEAGYTLKEDGGSAYIALKNPKQLETVQVTLGSSKIAGTMQAIENSSAVGYTIVTSTALSPSTALISKKSRLRGC